MEDKVLIRTIIDFTPSAKIETAFYLGRLIKPKFEKNIEGFLRAIVEKIDNTGRFSYELQGLETISGNPLVIDFHESDFIIKREWQ
jgi:hypothetical protein